MAKVSIIVPIYKVEQYVEKCIKSLMNQTFKEIEIWAISDGSPDHSMEIVKKLAEKDDRIKCIEKENGGYGSVLEYAIARIQTEYFLICDPDDWLEEEAVEKLYECAEENKVDLVVGQKYLVYEGQEGKEVNPCCLQTYAIEPNKVYSDLEMFVFMAVSPHSKLYKTELAKKIEFSHHVSYTDRTLYLVYLTKIKNAVYLDIPLSNYLIDRVGNSNNELESLSQKAFDGMIIVLNSIFEQLDKQSYLYSPICYSLYEAVLSITKKMAKSIDKDYFAENKKEIIAYLGKLKPEKKNMRKYIREKNIQRTFIKKVVFHLILNCMTGKLTLDWMIFFFYKNRCK